MRGCRNWGKEISAYLDGEMESIGRAGFESHLGECDACREALASQRRLAAALKTLPQVEPSAQFETDFWARISRVEQTASDRLTWAKRLRATIRLRIPPAPLWVRWGAVAAGLVVAALIVRQAETPAPHPNWPVVAGTDDFEVAINADPQLLEVLDLLEAWDES